MSSPNTWFTSPNPDENKSEAYHPRPINRDLQGDDSTMPAENFINIESEEEEDPVEDEEEEGNTEEREVTVTTPNFRPYENQPTVPRHTRTARMRVLPLAEPITFTFRSSSPQAPTETPGSYQDLLRSWRTRAGIPSSYEQGESSSRTPQRHPLTGESVDETVPLLVAMGAEWGNQLDRMNTRLDETRTMTDAYTGRVQHIEGRDLERDAILHQMHYEYEVTQEEVGRHNNRITVLEAGGGLMHQRWLTGEYRTNTLEQQVIMSSMRADEAEGRAAITEERMGTLEQQMEQMRGAMGVMANTIAQLRER